MTIRSIVIWPATSAIKIVYCGIHTTALLRCLLFCLLAKTCNSLVASIAWLDLFTLSILQACHLEILAPQPTQRGTLNANTTLLSYLPSSHVTQTTLVLSKLDEDLLHEDGKSPTLVDQRWPSDFAHADPAHQVKKDLITKELNLTSLRKFTANLKLQTPTPVGLLGLFAKQADIMEKSHDSVLPEITLSPQSITKLDKIRNEGFTNAITVGHKQERKQEVKQISRPHGSESDRLEGVIDGVEVTEDSEMKQRESEQSEEEVHQVVLNTRAPKRLRTLRFPSTTRDIHTDEFGYKEPEHFLDKKVKVNAKQYGIQDSMFSRAAQLSSGLELDENTPPTSRHFDPNCLEITSKKVLESNAFKEYENKLKKYHADFQIHRMRDNDKCEAADEFVQDENQEWTERLARGVAKVDKLIKQSTTRNAEMEKRGWKERQAEGGTERAETERQEWKKRLARGAAERAKVSTQMAPKVIQQVVETIERIKSNNRPEIHEGFKVVQQNINQDANDIERDAAAANFWARAQQSGIRVSPKQTLSNAPVTSPTPHSRVLSIPRQTEVNSSPQLTTSINVGGKLADQEQPSLRPAADPFKPAAATFKPVVGSLSQPAPSATNLPSEFVPSHGKKRAPSFSIKMPEMLSKSLKPALPNVFDRPRAPRYTWIDGANTNGSNDSDLRISSTADRSMAETVLTSANTCLPTSKPIAMAKDNSDQGEVPSQPALSSNTETQWVAEQTDTGDKTKPQVQMLSATASHKVVYRDRAARLALWKEKEAKSKEEKRVLLQKENEAHSIARQETLMCEELARRLTLHENDKAKTEAERRARLEREDEKRDSAEMRIAARQEEEHERALEKKKIHHGPNNAPLGPRSDKRQKAPSNAPLGPRNLNLKLSQYAPIPEHKRVESIDHPLNPTRADRLRELGATWARLPNLYKAAGRPKTPEAIEVALLCFLRRAKTDLAEAQSELNNCFLQSEYEDIAVASDGMSLIEEFAEAEYEYNELVKDLRRIYGSELPQKMAQEFLGSGSEGVPQLL